MIESINWSNVTVVGDITLYQYLQFTGSLFLYFLPAIIVILIVGFVLGTIHYGLRENFPPR